MKHLRLFCAVLAGLFLLSVAFEAVAQTDVIKARKKLMKANSKAAKAIKKALKKSDFGTIEAKARKIAANMDKIPDLFPQGSTSKKSRAKAVIWEKWDSFKKKAAGTKKAAEALAAAAVARNAEQVKANAKGLKCGSCHKKFRKPKKKKKR